MTHTATIDGRTLHLDGRRIALDDVSRVAPEDTARIEYLSPTLASVDRALGFLAFGLGAVGVVYLFMLDWLAMSLWGGACLLVVFASIGLGEIARLMGKARRVYSYSLRIDFTSGREPSFIFETPDKALAERVATTLRRVILEPAPSGPLVIDWRKGTIEAAGATS